MTTTAEFSWTPPGGESTKFVADLYEEQGEGEIRAEEEARPVLRRVQWDSEKNQFIADTGHGTGYLLDADHRDTFVRAASNALRAKLGKDPLPTG